MRPTIAVPRIVIAHSPGLDVFGDDHLEQMRELGELLDPSPITDWSDPHSIELLEECTVIVGHWGCPTITPEVLDRALRLGLIAYAAGTVKATIDPAAWQRGIRVTSGARANAEPVAQYTLASIVFANKQVFWRADDRDPMAVHVGMSLSSPIGNYDKTIGVIGASLTGRRVIELLRAIERTRVLVYDPFIDTAAAERLGVTKVELDELCATSDIVTVHAPALPSTHHLLAAEQLASMRDGTTLINTARGSLVDHAALAAEVRTGRLFAILDVTDPEPLPDGDELRGLPNVLITPHLAGSQGSELGRLAEHAIDEIGRWSRAEPANHEVTAEQLANMA